MCSREERCFRGLAYAQTGGSGAGDAQAPVSGEEKRLCDAVSEDSICQHYL